MIGNEDLRRFGAPIVVSTHMRSGTHLTMDLLRRQFASCRSWKFPGQANDSVYLALDVLSGLKATWGEERAMRLLGRSRRPLLKAHWTKADLSNLRERQPFFAAWLEEKAVFLHIVRNPYKVMASMWAWELSQGKVNGRPSQDWVQKRFGNWARRSRMWQEKPGCHLLRFEDVVRDTNAVLASLSRLLDEAPLGHSPLLPHKLNGLWHSRWNRMFSWCPESTEILTETKAPTVKALFGEEHVALVEPIAGGLMNEFGYSLNPAEA